MSEPVWEFRPRVVSVISTGMAISLVAVFGVIWFRLPDVSQQSFTVVQRITLLVFAAVILGILVRMATLKVTAYDDGLLVRNVFRTYRMDWTRMPFSAAWRKAPSQTRSASGRRTS